MSLQMSLKRFALLRLDGVILSLQNSLLLRTRSIATGTERTEEEILCPCAVKRSAATTDRPQRFERRALADEGIEKGRYHTSSMN